MVKELKVERSEFESVGYLNRIKEEILGRWFVCIILFFKDRMWDIKI